MKSILKIVAALATMAGIVYAVATYGDKIVAWAKSLMEGCPCKKCKCDVVVSDADAASEDVEEAPAEEEAPVEAAPEADESEPVAEETDFEA